MKEHCKECGSDCNSDTILNILDKTTRGIVVLSVLEALHIRELKPTLNTKDEFNGRLLRIRL